MTGPIHPAQPYPWHPTPETLPLRRDSNGSGVDCMTMNNKVSLFIGGLAIVSALVAGFLLWAWHLTRTDIEQAKPYVTYSKLLYAAEVCERYKAQYAVCQTNLFQ